MNKHNIKSGPSRPFKFKSDYRRRAWWFLNNSTSHPDPDPELTWWLWCGRLILSFIDWLNRLVGAGKPKVKNTAEQKIEDDPLGFLGEWVSTKFGMSSGDFRYGSRFYIKSFNKRKQCYTADCPPMGDNEIQLSVQTLIDFEASPGDGKRKTNGEQMATLGELFEEVEPGIDWGADEDYTAISIID